MHYNDSIPKIPAIAISTLDAEKVSQLLKKEPALEFFFKTNSKSLPDVKSYNIIAEFRGMEKPKEIITVGGHTDCWDVGEGANDDGVGCIQSMEVARLFRQLKITTKRTIRVVLFIDEEMNQTGAKAYAKSVKENGEVIYAALESDSGAGVARGFGCSASDEKFQKFQALEKYFDQYGITQFYKGGGGVDIGPLRQFGVPLLNLHPDPQRYFDYHHSANDTFENISNREMQTGSAAMASLIFLIDKYNLF
jgi:Zn-dependent M28 family amino/carboxypeptidase